MKAIALLLFTLAIVLVLVAVSTHDSRNTANTSVTANTTKLTPSKEARYVASRDKAIHHIGWVAANAYTHPIWNELKEFVGEGGDYYQLVRLGTPGRDNDLSTYLGNKRTYDEAFARGSQHPPDAQECMRLVTEVQSLMAQMTTILKDAKAELNTEKPTESAATKAKATDEEPEPEPAAPPVQRSEPTSSNNQQAIQNLLDRTPSIHRY